MYRNFCKMLQNTLFILFLTTSWTQVALAGSEIGDFVSPDLDEKTVRFFCQPTFRTPYCSLVCKLFPQFCQPETTTTPAVTTTGGPTTTPSPPTSEPTTQEPTGVPSICTHEVTCRRRDIGPFCFSCVTCPDSERTCCNWGDVHIPALGCPEGDYSCYVCPNPLTTTTQVPETTTLPATTTPISTTQAPTTTSSPVETCTATCDHKELGSYPSPDNCQSYYNCDPDGIHFQTCFPLLFNYATLKCEGESPTTVCYECVPGSPVTLPTTTTPPPTTTIPATTQSPTTPPATTPIATTPPATTPPATTPIATTPPATTPPATTPIATTPSATTPPLTTTTGISGPFETCTKTCENRENGLYASPENCNDFYTCQDGVISASGTCPELDRFNYATMKCELNNPFLTCYYDCVPGVPLTRPPQPVTTPPPTTTPPATTPPATTPPPTTTVASVPCGSPPYSCTGLGNGFHQNPWDCNMCQLCIDGVVNGIQPCSTDPSFSPPTCACEDGIHRTTAPRGNATRACANHCSAPPTLPTTTVAPATTPPATIPPATTPPATTPNPETTTFAYVANCFVPFTCVGLHNGIAQVPWDCHEWRGCHNNVAIPWPENECPQTATWSYNADHQSCVSSEECVDACGGDEPTTVTECPPTQDIPTDCAAPFSCVGKANILIQDPFSCKDFRRCQCSKEVPLIASNCPPVMTFDAERDRCVYTTLDCVNVCPNAEPTARIGSNYTSRYTNPAWISKGPLPYLVEE